MRKKQYLERYQTSPLARQLRDSYMQKSNKQMTSGKSLYYEPNEREMNQSYRVKYEVPLTIDDLMAQQTNEFKIEKQDVMVENIFEKDEEDVVETEQNDEQIMARMLKDMEEQNRNGVQVSNRIGEEMQKYVDYFKYEQYGDVIKQQMDNEYELNQSKMQLQNEMIQFIKNSGELLMGVNSLDRLGLAKLDTTINQAKRDIQSSDQNIERMKKRIREMEQEAELVKEQNRVLAEQYQQQKQKNDIKQQEVDILRQKRDMQNQKIQDRKNVIHLQHLYLNYMQRNIRKNVFIFQNNVDNSDMILRVSANNKIQVNPSQQFVELIQKQQQLDMNQFDKKVRNEQNINGYNVEMLQLEQTEQLQNMKMFIRQYSTRNIGEIYDNINISNDLYLGIFQLKPIEIEQHWIDSIQNMIFKKKEKNANNEKVNIMIIGYKRQGLIEGLVELIASEVSQIDNPIFAVQSVCVSVDDDGQMGTQYMDWRQFRTECEQVHFYREGVAVNIEISIRSTSRKDEVYQKVIRIHHMDVKQMQAEVWIKQFNQSRNSTKNKDKLYRNTVGVFGEVNCFLEMGSHSLEEYEQTVKVLQILQNIK